MQISKRGNFDDHSFVSRGMGFFFLTLCSRYESSLNTAKRAALGLLLYN